jgi:outer membrane protein assembly factor BamB
MRRRSEAGTSPRLFTPGTNGLVTAVTLGVALLSSACGGESERRSPTNGLLPDATGGAAPSAAGSSGGGAPVSNSPFPASTCKTKGGDVCTEFVTGIHDGIYALAVDPDGNLLLGGRALASGGAAFAFIAKYTPDLEPLWFESLDSSLIDVSQLVVDGAGNIVAAGASNGAGAPLLKLSTNGELMWLRSWTGTSADGAALAMDGAGNAVLGGFDTNDLFLVKYSPDGDLLWDEEWSRGKKGLEAEYVAADAGGNIFLPTGVPLTTGAPWMSDNLEKHGPAGELDWSVEVGGTLLSGLVVGPSGDPFVLFEIPEPSLTRYSAENGAVLWTAELKDFSPTYSLSSDPSGNIYAAGMANDFKSGYLGVVAKYSPDGERLFSEELAVPIGITALHVAGAGDGTAFVVGPNNAGSGTFITHVAP